MYYFYQDGRAKEFSTAQDRLRESTYLYHALLQASYEFLLILDLQNNTVECAPEALFEQLPQSESLSASERVLAFLNNKVDVECEESHLHHNIAFGRLTEPVELEVCCDMGKHQEETWYHLVAVPIIIDGKKVEKVVLHFENITQEKHEEFRLIHSSQVDPLCGLFNKTAFPLQCRLSEPSKTDIVFFIDLDGFKQVNDNFGHATGDEVLIEAAEAVREQFRSGDVVGRFGGDEFVVFAPGMSLEQSKIKAAALVEVLSFVRESQMAKVHVTASVGVCVLQWPMDLPKAITLADEAMYIAKENGKSQFFIKN